MVAINEMARSHRMKQPKTIDTYVVNLERSEKRRSEMSTKLDALNIPYEFFDAVDGRMENHPLFVRYSERSALKHYGFELAPGELGCYASHFLLWQLCVEKDKPILILEDDIEFNFNFNSAYELAVQKIHEYGLLRLSGHKIRKYAICEQIRELKIVRFKRGPHGTSSYALSPLAAKKLISKAEVWYEPVDVHLDRFWSHGVESFGIQPFPVSHVATSEADSEIWQGKRRGSRPKEFKKNTRFIRLNDSLRRFFVNIPYIGRWKHK